MKKKIKKRYFIYGILSLLLITLIYGQLRGIILYNEFKIPGKMVEVNGHKMHIYGEGKNQNTPTVVFTSGWKTPSPYVDYLPLQEKVAKYTRTVTYERPGYGWSEKANGERDMDTLAMELYQLLKSSGETGPYILVGHSFGANEVIRFAQLYPEEVDSVVLLDGSNPNYTVTQKRPSKYFLRYGTITSTIFNNTLNFLNTFGISRLLFDATDLYETKFTHYKNDLKLVSNDMKELDEMMFIKNMNNKNQLHELRMDAVKLVKDRNIGSVPLVVMTSSLYNDSKFTNDIQSDLLSWSTNSKQIIVPNSQHYIQWFNPELIDEQIKELIKEKF
jgi:pimeloyl-ACP methyl ester carboxylesterase